MFDVIREINNLEEKYGEEFNWGTVLFLLDSKVYRIYHLTYSDGELRYTEFLDGKKVVEYIEKRFVDEYC